MLAILSLSTNLPNPEIIHETADKLMTILDDMRLSGPIRTEPVGMPEGTPDYFNAIAIGHTSMEYELLRATLKDLETQAGRTQEKSASGIIPLDIDILMYGDMRYKDDDWEREYNKALLRDVGF
ncbi:MAG: 2-amino-4-hydroxy-6-hydroxymethyldihydropteridine diphosphokinase [Prevotella sp.]